MKAAQNDEAQMMTLTEFDDVTVEVQAGVAIVRLNHPKTLNAISPRMAVGLAQALAHVDSREDLRCAILTGNGRGFCSGANLTTTGPDDILKQDDLGQALRERYYPVLRQMRDFRMPLVVAVNGPALGFGFSLALMGDIILAARHAFFQLTFSRIGLVPDGGAPWLLPRIVGMARAKELIVLAERLDAEKALEWGVINQVHDDERLMDAALVLANELTQRPTPTLKLTRRAYWDGLSNSYEAQLALEAELQTKAGETGDFVEGVMAFREKRPPVFGTFATRLDRS
jgi:2-(1,2-epoxy-1,2-dihydrophenyl)acetyl-CoA isomerase